MVLLAGCKIELNSNLEEQDANEALAELLSSGIGAEKQKSTDGTYKLLVKENNFATAVQVLKSAGLPRRRFIDMSDTFNGEGIVSSPMQEWARYNYTITQQITKTILSLPGVVDANLHIAIPKDRGPLHEEKDPTASVLIKVHENSLPGGTVSEIKRLVAFGIENLKYENVSVMMAPAKIVNTQDNMVNFAGMTVHNDNLLIFRVIVSSIFILISILIFFIYYNVFRSNLKYND